ncbi:MAG: PEP-CTERM sorting domain-containing protein [Planctomycetaceae bacterium]|uniref:Ice-binding protein C-terminal domain-containing protein n=1 Tax=Lacipirellula limnantheis TaxID=2528024 RepID=A0A517TZD8_9BACT|nr:PEP-CTERM sorting domain-containing protein [Lacipirellula limnantheis]MBL9165849.1 PEP-CTERM sorting domain-containing protein [Planctomycetaceae bacterium]QDT73725.1 hypothetical protein I41_29160 [Lacipirellula limnantheis]
MKRYCWGLFVAALMSAFTGTASANLLTNPGFENPVLGGGDTFGAVGWNVFGGGTYTIKLAPHSGDNAFKTFGQTSGAYQEFPASAGENWAGGAYLLNPSFDALAGAQIAAVNIEWRDAGDNLISFISSPNGLTAASPQGSTAADYVYAPVAGIAPAGTAKARFVLLTGAFAGPGGGAPFFDDASFARVPEPATVLLVGAGAVGIIALRRRQG